MSMDDDDNNNNSSDIKPSCGDKGYESLSRDTIQQIQNADALAIWSLLKSIPNQWIIRKKWVMSELNLGEMRYSKAVQRLRDLGLWKIVRQRNDQGKILGSSIQILDMIETTNIPHHGKTDITGNPKIRKSRVTYEVNTSKDPIEKEIKKRPARGGNPMGSGFKKTSLTFHQEFGLSFSDSLSKVLDENRAAAICKKFNLDVEDARKVLAEFAAMVVRNQVNDPYAAFVKLCQLQFERNLDTSKLGEDNKPEWS